MNRCMMIEIMNINGNEEVNIENRSKYWKETMPGKTEQKKSNNFKWTTNDRNTSSRERNSVKDDG